MSQRNELDNYNTEYIDNTQDGNIIVVEYGLPTFLSKLLGINLQDTTYFGVRENTDSVPVWSQYPNQKPVSRWQANKLHNMWERFDMHEKNRRIIGGNK